MAILKYTDPKDNLEYYKIRIVRKSQDKPGVRVDKVVKRILTFSEAEKIERGLIKEADREIFRKESEGEKWGVLVNDWYEATSRKELFTRDLGVRALEDYIQMLKSYTRDWYSLNIEEIDRTKAWMLLDKIEREVSISKRKRVRTAIDAVFAWGNLSGRIENMKTPCEGFKTSRKAAEKLPEILTLDEIKTLLKVAKGINHPWYEIWALALLTGMRSGELYALQWDAVDFENSTIYVHRNWTSKAGLSETKGRYWRAVPMNPDLMAMLKELKIKRAGEKSVLHRFNLWTKGRQAEILREFCSGYNLTSIKFHTLRACFATQLIKDGVAPAIVMKIAGWKDLKTMQRYIRLAGIEIRGATEKLKILPEKEVMGRVHELFAE